MDSPKDSNTQLKKPISPKNTLFYENQNKTPNNFRPVGYSSPFHEAKKSQHKYAPYKHSKGPFIQSNTSSKMHQHKGNSTDISQYFHPSMLQDPWKNLYKWPQSETT